MIKTTINGHSIDAAEAIADLKDYFDLRFIKGFDSLEEFMEEMLDTYNPYSEFYSEYNAENREGRYGMLAGSVDGENNYCCWAVEVYKLEDVDFDRLAYGFPVLVEYNGEKYIVNTEEC